MSARHKLNQGYIQGCLLAAGVVGYLGQSWAAFWVTASILIALCYHSGDVRPHDKAARRQSRHRRRPPRF